MRNLLAYGHRPGGSWLSASPRTVLSRFLSFVQHVQNGRQRRRGERTKAQEGIRPPEEVPYYYWNYWTSLVAKWHCPTAVLPGFNSTCAGKISPIFLPLPLLTCGSPLSSTHTTSNSCQNFVPRFLCFSHTRHCVGILKIAYLFDCASYEDVLCMNVDQHDVNWLVVPVSTMNKTSSMMLTLFERPC